MARDAHSASSIALASACEHAWALRYIDDFREPELTWAEIQAGAEYTPRQRSTALGKEMHAIAERYYAGTATQVDWDSLPGQMLHSGLHLLPPRDAPLTVCRTELPLGSTYGVLHSGGVAWRGSIDLEVVDADFCVTVVDHKSSANLDKYPLTPEQLHDDLQACLYAVDVCTRYDVGSVRLKWVYYESKKRRRARAVETVVTHAHALAVVARAAELARKLGAYKSSAEAPKNPTRCLDYGGRPCHKSQGGPCDARIPLVQLARLGRPLTTNTKQRKIDIMAISPEVAAKFSAFKVAPAVVSPAPDADEDTRDTTPAPPLDESEPTDEDTKQAHLAAPEVPAKRAGAGRPPGAKNKPKPKETSPAEVLADVRAKRAMPSPATVADVQIEMRRAGMLPAAVDEPLEAIRVVCADIKACTVEIEALTMRRNELIEQLRTIAEEL